MKTEKLIRTTIRLPKHLKKILEKEAKKNNISLAELIRIKISNNDPKTFFCILHNLQQIKNNISRTGSNINQITRYVNVYKNVDIIAAEELQKQIKDLEILKQEIRNIIKELKDKKC